MLNLKPEVLWKYFEEISKIPRGSGNEERVGQYVLDVAKGFGLKAKKDKVGNILVEVPASEGSEGAPVVVLQCHLDMVCEKNEGVEHDFKKDPIKLKVSGDYLMADGTSLGADNGIGVATCLALMEEKEYKRGPLELLFTVDEETGLNGAFGLSSTFVKGRKLINLDSEEEGVIYIGCAGGRDTVLKFKAERKKRSKFKNLYKISIKGLRGGHSGVDIHEGRACANLLITRFLIELLNIRNFELYSISGGSKRNAIAREAFAVIGTDKDIKKFAENQKRIFLSEYGKIDPGLDIIVEKIKPELKPLDDKFKEKLLNFLSTIPHGVLKMSFDLPNLVETSTNFAIIETREKEIEIATSQRSSLSSGLDWAAGILSSLGKISGAKVEQSKGYPGWKPEPDSELLKKVSSTFERVFGSKPQLKAIHAGLECGIIGEHYKGMDMVSIGPQIENVHSPSERVHIQSVERFYNFLKEILKDLA
ncbi:MAG: aminoacyl-histidine dipeptidase [Thermoanaerobaculia bacterium]